MFINIPYCFLLDFIWGLLCFPPFPLVIALSVLLGFTTSGYPFYKLFFQLILDMCSINALWKFWRHYSRMRQNRSTLPEYLINFFQWSSCFSIFSFICMFCRSLFVLLYFFAWPLCSLFLFDIQILIINLVSQNSSFRFL
jgi:hypothetical protein